MPAETTTTQPPALAEVARTSALAALRVAREAQPRVTKVAAVAVAAAEALVAGDFLPADAAADATDDARWVLTRLSEALIAAIVAAEDAQRGWSLDDPPPPDENNRGA